MKRQYIYLASKALTRITLQLALLCILRTVVSVAPSFFSVKSFLSFAFFPNFIPESCQQELHADIQSQFLPEMLSAMLQALRSHMDSVSLDDVTQCMRACFKVLSKIQMPVAYMDVEAEVQADDTDVQPTVDEIQKEQV